MLLKIKSRFGVKVDAVMIEKKYNVIFVSQK